MVNKKAKLFVFSAPSGSGKTTIVREILKIFPELIFSISATTRKKRKNEIDGKDYFFIDETEFENKVRNNEFIEWEKFYDYYYGTLVEFIEDQLNNSKSVVLEVDVKGALNIKQSYPDSVLIFIMPPSIEELKKRLLQRQTESEEDFLKRIHRAEMELSYNSKFDYIVVNDSLDRAKNEVLEIIRKEIN